MVVLGLLLIAAGVVVILAGIFTTESRLGGVEVLGIDVGPVTLFLLGVGAAAAVLWGFALFRFGTKRALQARRERKQLSELNEKLDRVQAEERRDHDQDDNKPH